MFFRTPSFWLAASLALTTVSCGGVEDLNNLADDLADAIAQDATVDEDGTVLTDGTAEDGEGTDTAGDADEDVATARGGWTFTDEAWDEFRPRQGQTSTVSVITDRDETAALTASVVENVAVYDGTYDQITYGTPAPGTDAFRVTLDMSRPWRIGVKAIEVWYSFQVDTLANSWVLNDVMYIPLDSLVGSRQRVNATGLFTTSGLTFPDYTLRMDWQVIDRELNYEVPFGAFRASVTELVAETISSDKPGGEYEVRMFLHPEAGLLYADLVQEIFINMTLLNGWL
ncbi:MAG: hypothetical protein ACI81R_000737 [Bradymonadia bacterium]|jgi:hypothetical protein